MTTYTTTETDVDRLRAHFAKYDMDFESGTTERLRELQAEGKTNREAAAQTLQELKAELESVKAQTQTARSDAETRTRLMVREEGLASEIRKFEVATARALVFGEDPFTTLQRLHDQTDVMTQGELDDLKDTQDIYSTGGVDRGKFPWLWFGGGLIALGGFAYWRNR